MLVAVSTPLRHLVVGALVAIGIALLLIPSLGGIATWKYVLAALGLALWLLAERKRD